MNPLIQSKNKQSCQFSSHTLGCFALSPKRKHASDATTDGG